MLDFISEDDQNANDGKDLSITKENITDNKTQTELKFLTNDDIINIRSNFFY